MILAGLVTATAILGVGIALLSLISFGIMGISGAGTPYQMAYAYSIYVMNYGQYYLLTVVCGYIASLLAAALSMLVAAKIHTISVAVCIPFFSVLCTAVYWAGTLWIQYIFQSDSNYADKCGGSRKSTACLSDWRTCGPTDTARYGDVYSCRSGSVAVDI